MRKTALLVLADGNVFKGVAIGSEGVTTGEVVFNTAMTGYQEILTDPSYASQLVTLTYPHIGNTGCNPEDAESDKVHASALIIRDLPDQFSNWRATESLESYLIRHGISGIAEIDTRRLTRILREKGAQNACLVTDESLSESEALEKAGAFPGLQGMDLAKAVTCTQPYDWVQGSWQLALNGSEPVQDTRFNVVAYDFGIKQNILRMLADRGCNLTVVPATTKAETVLAMKPDGIFLSNGPGDPVPCDYAIEAIKTFLDHKIPMFGICLGHQLLSIAAGAQTEKMKFGHHGANHPVQDLGSKKVMISSQNHGFAVAESSLPDCLQASHRSLFDGSLQGVKHREAPAYGFQGHPEASPGPHDVQSVFDPFIELMSA